MVMLTATTGGWFSALSDTKKGVVAILASIALGFAVGTATVAQVGLPQRVESLEVRSDSTVSRLSALEIEHDAAVAERDYILDLLEWNTCAAEANAGDRDLHDVCGTAPIRRNR